MRGLLHAHLRQVVLDKIAVSDPRLAKQAVAARSDGELVDLSHPLRRDVGLQILTARDPESLEVLRHSTAHATAASRSMAAPSAALPLRRKVLFALVAVLLGLAVLEAGLALVEAAVHRSVEDLEAAVVAARRALELDPDLAVAYRKRDCVLDKRVDDCIEAEDLEMADHLAAMRVALFSAEKEAA